MLFSAPRKSEVSTASAMIIVVHRDLLLGVDASYAG
jgi:hypothetical protein